jgi:WD40 repeat protein
VLNGHEDWVNSASFSPDGTRVVTASEDNTARLWDVSTLVAGGDFAIACARLGNDIDLADVHARYGLGGLEPICGDHPPLAVDWSKLQ